MSSLVNDSQHTLVVSNGTKEDCFERRPFAGSLAVLPVAVQAIQGTMVLSYDRVVVFSVGEV